MRTIKDVILAIITIPVGLFACFCTVCYDVFILFMTIIFCTWYWLRDDLEFGEIKEFIGILLIPFIKIYYEPIWGFKNKNNGSQKA